jgi:hypothetical protein
MIVKCNEALQSGIKPEEVKASLVQAFYTRSSSDQLFQAAISRTAQAVWQQLFNPASS